MFRFIKYLESIWRHRFVYPVLRFFIRNKQIDKPIDILSIKKIMIIRYDRIGDMIVTTPIFRNLKNINSNIEIGVLASKKNAEIIKNNPYVDNIYLFNTNLFLLLKELRRIRKEKYDIVFNFVFTKMTFAGILVNIIAPNGIKIGQGKDKYKFFFNRLLSFQRDKMIMSELLALFVNEAVGVNILPSECNYEIFIDENIRANIHKYLAKHKLTTRQTKLPNCLQYIVLNISASDKWSKLSDNPLYLFCPGCIWKLVYRKLLMLLLEV